MKHRKVPEENRHYLKTVCEVQLLRSTQKIAHRESGSIIRDADILWFKLWQLLGDSCMVAKHDPIVAKKITYGPRNAKYTHHSIQNAIFHTMADMDRQEIRDEIS